MEPGAGFLFEKKTSDGDDDLDLPETLEEIVKARKIGPEKLPELREKVERVRTLIRMVGSAVGRDTRLKWEPGYMWAIYPDENTATYPLEHLLTHSPEEIVGLTDHEALHREITVLDERYPLVRKYTEDPIKHFLWNGLEDPRVNSRGIHKLPGAERYLHAAYDRYLPEDLDIDAAREWAALGESGQNVPEGDGASVFNPAVLQYPHIEYIMAANYLWRYGKRPKKFLNKSAEEAFDKSREDMKKIFADYPRDGHPSDDEKLARSLSALKAIDEKILPLYEPLVKQSAEKMAKNQKKSKGKSKKGNGKGKRGGPGAMPPDPKDKRRQKPKPQDGQGGGKDQKKNKDEKKPETKPEGSGAGEKNGEDLDEKDLKRALKELQDMAREASDKLGSRLKENPKRKDAGLGRRDDGKKGKDKGAGEAPTASSGDGESEALTIEDIAERQRRMRMEEQRTPYKRSHARVASQVGQMVSRLENIFFKNSRPKDVGFYRKGKKPHMKRAIRREKEGGWKQDIWLRRVYNTKRSYSVTILIDESGSMGGNLREALDTVVLMLEGLTRLRIEVEIIGFNETARVYKKFDEALTPEKREQIAREIEANLGNGMTHDADAVQLALDRIQGRQTDRKGIFVVTDGAGNGNAGISNVLPKAEKAGVFVMGVGIGAGMAYVEQAYPQHTVVDSVASLPGTLYKQLEEYFHSVERTAAAKAAGRPFNHAVGSIRNGVTGPASPLPASLRRWLRGLRGWRLLLLGAAAAYVGVLFAIIPYFAGLAFGRGLLKVLLPIGIGIVISHSLLGDWASGMIGFSTMIALVGGAIPGWLVPWILPAGALLATLIFYEHFESRLVERRGWLRTGESGALAALKPSPLAPHPAPDPKAFEAEVRRLTKGLLGGEASRAAALRELGAAKGLDRFLPMMEHLALLDSSVKVREAALEAIGTQARRSGKAKESMMRLGAHPKLMHAFAGKVRAELEELEEATRSRAELDGLAGKEAAEQDSAGELVLEAEALTGTPGAGTFIEQTRRRAILSALESYREALAGTDADAIRVARKRLEDQVRAAKRRMDFLRPFAGLAGLNGVLKATPARSWGRFTPHGRGWMALEVLGVAFFFIGAATDLNNGLAFLGGMIGFWTGCIMDRRAAQGNANVPMTGGNRAHILKWHKKLVQAKGAPAWEDYFEKLLGYGAGERLRGLESLRNAGPWTDPDLAELLEMLVRAETAPENLAAAADVLAEMGEEGVLDALISEAPSGPLPALQNARAEAKRVRKEAGGTVSGIVENLKRAEPEKALGENERLLARANEALGRLPGRNLALRAKREGLVRAVLKLEEALADADADRIQIAAKRLEEHLRQTPPAAALFAKPAGVLNGVSPPKALRALGPADTLTWLAYAAYVPTLFLLPWPFVFLPVLVWGGAMMYLSFFKFRNGGIEPLLLFMSGMSALQVLVQTPGWLVPWVSTAFGLGSVGLLMLIFAQRHAVDWGTYLAMRRARRAAGLDKLGRQDQYRKLVRLLSGPRSGRLAVLKAIKGYPGSIRRLLPLITVLAVRDRAPGVADLALELIIEVAADSETGYEALKTVADSDSSAAPWAQVKVRDLEASERRRAEDLLDKLAQEEAGKQAAADAELLAAAHEVLESLPAGSFSARQRRQAVERAIERFQEALDARDEDAVRLTRDRLKEQLKAARSRMGFFAGALGMNRALPGRSPMGRLWAFMKSDAFAIGLMQASWIIPGLSAFIIGWSAVYVLGASLPAAIIFHIARTLLGNRKGFGHPFPDAVNALEPVLGSLGKAQRTELDKLLRRIPKERRRTSKFRVRPAHPSELLVWSMPEYRRRAWGDAWPLLRANADVRALAALQAAAIRGAGRSLFAAGNTSSFDMWIGEEEYERLAELGDAGRDELISLFDEDFGSFHVRRITEAIGRNALRWSWKDGAMDRLRAAAPELAARLEGALLTSVDTVRGELERGGEDVLGALLSRARVRIEAESGPGSSFVGRKRAAYLRRLVETVESLREGGPDELAVEVKRLEDALKHVPVAMAAGRSAAGAVPGLNAAAGERSRFFKRMKRFFTRPDVVTFFTVPAVEAAIFGGMSLAVMSGVPVPKQWILLALIGSGIITFGRKKGKATRGSRLAAAAFFLSLSAFLALGAVNHSAAELPVLVPMMWLCISFLMTYVMVGAVRKARMDFLPYGSRDDLRRFVKGLDLDARQRDWGRMLGGWHRDRFAALGEMLEDPAAAEALKPAVWLLPRYETFPGIHGRLIELLGWWGDDDSLSALRQLGAYHDPAVRSAAQGMIELVEQKRTASEQMDKLLEPVKVSPEGPLREAGELLARARETVGDPAHGSMPQRIWKRAVDAAADNLEAALSAGEKAGILVAIQRLRDQLALAEGKI